MASVSSARRVAPGRSQALLRTARLLDLEERLEGWGEPHASALEWLVPELAELIDAPKTFACRFTYTGKRWHTDFVHHAPGISPFAKAAFLQFMQRYAGQDFGAFNATRPEREQRNRVLYAQQVLGPKRYEGVGLYPLLEQLRMTDHDAVRALVCDGPRLLTWIGAYRDVRFESQAGAILSRLLPALRRRLVLEERLSSLSRGWTGLEKTLDALAGPAWLVRRDGHVVLRNGLARCMALPTNVDLLSLAQRSRTDAHHPFEYLKLSTRGVPLHYLVLQRESAADTQARLQGAALRWRLSPRQTEILASVAAGSTNRDIAARLEIGERSVERQIARIMRLAECASRIEVLRKFWSMPLHVRGS